MKGLEEGASLLPLGFTVPPLPVLSSLRPSTRPGCERVIRVQRWLRGDRTSGPISVLVDEVS